MQRRAGGPRGRTHPVAEGHRRDHPVFDLDLQAGCRIRSASVPPGPHVVAARLMPGRYRSPRSDDVGVGWFQVPAVDIDSTR